MTEDWINQGYENESWMKNQIFENINPILLHNGLQCVDLSFPDLPRYDTSIGNSISNRNWMLHEEEESFDVNQSDLNSTNLLNFHQRFAFDKMMDAFHSEQPACFFYSLSWWIRKKIPIQMPSGKWQINKENCYSMCCKWCV